MKALFFEPDKEGQLIDIENTLEALQKAVGGYIECVPVLKDAVIICNEEGLIRNLPPNYLMGYEFRGNLLMVGIGREDFKDVPIAALELFWRLS